MEANREYKPEISIDPPVEQVQTSPFAPVQISIPAPMHVKMGSGASGVWRLILIFVILFAMLVSACGVTAFLVNRHWEKEMTLYDAVMDNKLSVMQAELERFKAWLSVGQTPQDQLLTPGQVYANNVNAVVAITNQGITTNIYGQISETASSGSGFLISDNGYVVTNYHVVDGAKKLTVLTHSGQSYAARIVGYEEANDICLLKIEGENFPYVVLGDSEFLAVGDQVAAIGNPLGELTSTLTVGHVSAKDRLIYTDGVSINMLQTDVAINAGNSGGPLFNMKGQIVGITTAKYSGTSSSGASIEGISFAIPINDVSGMIEDLMQYGYITGGYMGITTSDVSSELQAYGVPNGAYVHSVESGSAAYLAGIRAQDVIINIGGYDIACMSDLRRVLRNFPAGKTTTITVYREGSNVNLSITMGQRPTS